MELIGSRFGHIRIVGVLGQGGMGDVYAGYDETLQRRVALKAIRPEQRLDLEARSRLIREARTLSQLEHPNICRIYDYIEGKELGKDVDLLVLELIEGKTLEESLRHGLSPAEKLRIADAMARVLVAAHRAGIIHRDLKPENVMLTPAGEVKVLDFGLARWTEKSPGSGPAEAIKPAASIRTQLLKVAPEVGADWLPVEDGAVASTLIVTPPAPADKRRDRGVMATAAGVTMGTPLYMSPEQARGETLTPASDMYSFGLVMQTLFTGREPYDATMTGREVMQAASRGESLPVHGADRDITALVNRLKQLAPTDRPTAVEALDRLRWIAERPKRLARRISAAAVILVVVLSAWKYVTDLRRERAAAVAAETEARARRAQAEDLISFMLGDLRTKLEPVGRLDVLNDVAAKAMQYVGAKSKNVLSVQELIDHSKALNQIGEVRIAQGDLGAAKVLFDHSLDLAETAVRQDPQNDDARLALALSNFWVGNAYRLQNDTGNAMPRIRSYLSGAEQLARHQPGNEKYQLEIAYAHSLLGLLLEADKNFDGALAEYRTTLAIKEAHAARNPRDDNAQDDIARTLNKIAYVLQKQGELSQARSTFEREIAIRQRLVASNTKQMSWKKNLAISHSMLSGVLEEVGDIDGALLHRRADVALHTELCEVDPSNATWRRNLAVGRAWLAALLLGRGDIRGARVEADAAERAIKGLVGAGKNRRLWSNDLAAIQVVQSRTLLAAKRTTEARAKAAEAVASVGRAEDRDSQYRLASACLQLGYVDAAAGNAGLARTSWERTRALLSPVVTGAEPRQMEVWARALIALHDERAEAVVARLHQIGYRNQEFEKVCNSQMATH
jgi:serine/threonine protein kinase